VPFKLAWQGELRHNESEKNFPLLAGTSYALAQKGALGKFLALTGETLHVKELPFLLSDLKLVGGDALDSLVQLNSEKPIRFFQGQFERYKE
jgi:hypothetical protein